MAVELDIVADWVYKKLPQEISKKLTGGDVLSVLELEAQGMEQFCGERNPARAVSVEITDHDNFFEIINLEGEAEEGKTFTHCDVEAKVLFSGQGCLISLEGVYSFSRGFETELDMALAIRELFE